MDAIIFGTNQIIIENYVIVLLMINLEQYDKIKKKLLFLNIREQSASSRPSN